MKKIISFIGIIAILLSMTLTAFAGSIPEDLLAEDNANLYIGTIEDFTDEETPSSPYIKVTSVSVTPTEKIKGDVEIGKTIQYSKTNMHLKLEKGKNYLIAYLNEHNLYAYEIKSKTDKEIKLVNSDKYDMVQRLENYINEGAYAMAEQERADIGNQISFAEFLYAKPMSGSNVKKVTFRIQDELHEVDVDKFEKLAKEIMITNVKNERLHDEIAKPKQNEPYKTNLYIELLDENEQHVGYAAVSRHGEVDRYALMMGRLMKKDYEMKTEDLQKLYSLFPKDVQKNIVVPEGIPSSEEPLELPDMAQKNYIPWLYGGAIVIFAIAFAIGVAVRKKK